jgi:ankyrin repeat protein
VRERSTREHRSTLLHYVSANGVEDFRQKTPTNIVEIARQLLDAGADVNAESDAYGGRATTLGLAATSCHPANAGVQLALLQLFLDRGAIIDRPDGGSSVNDCLHNGRGQAAAFLAGMGARLDLEGAAGVGRLDLVQGSFDHEGALKPPASARQFHDGFAWACQFGRTLVVDLLLRRGMDLHASLAHHGQTGLHWAAYGGHAGTVKLLLDRGARIDATDQVYGGTPLGWALYAWGNAGDAVERTPYYEVVALLIGAGAKLDPRWCEENDEKLRADPRMQSALRGEAVS